MIAFTLNCIESMLFSLCKDVDALKESCEHDTGAISPQKVSSNLPTTYANHVNSQLAKWCQWKALNWGWGSDITVTVIIWLLI